MDLEALRLPKSVQADPRGARLAELLRARAVILWPGGALRVPVARLAPALADALQSARAAGRVVRGLESAERTLAAEERGLELADRRAGVERGARVSRLLIVASDGAERFYRRVEALLRRHGRRVLAVRVEAGAEELGALLFGPGRRARLLLLEHKDAVAAVLLALAAPGGSTPPAPPEAVR